MSPKKRSNVCLVNSISKHKFLFANQSKESQEVQNYVPPGDLAKSANVKNSNKNEQNQENNADQKGLKVDLEKKFNPYYNGKQEQSTGANPDLPREIQDEGQEFGGKYADRIAEENRRELIAKIMTQQQIQEEQTSGFYKDAPIFELTSNSQIDEVINWRLLLTKQFKNNDNPKETQITMGGNKTHQNLLLVYNPQCPHCMKMKDDWIILSKKLNQKKVNLNMLSINDGIKDYKKLLPGNLKIEYYPMILLLKNDQDQSVVEFNTEQEGSKVSYEYNLNGFEKFLYDNQIQGLN